MKFRTLSTSVKWRLHMGGERNTFVEAGKHQGSQAERVLWGEPLLEPPKAPFGKMGEQLSPDILPTPQITDEKKVVPIPQITEEKKVVTTCPDDTNSGSSLDRTNAFFKEHFRAIDGNHDGQISQEEVNGRLKTATCSNELRALSWLDKHMKAVGKLGDDTAGFSMEDLRAFNDAAQNGTGNIKWALKDINFIGRAIGSAAGPYIASRLLGRGMSTKEMLTMGALYFGVSTAVDIGWYYFVDRGKINEAIGDLNGDRK